ncbi:MAG: hypothetical protein K6E55_05295 [Thermoguttaceae bacterium]|nr:hypothetical protein [Thermoguttaceae bacterium]
MKGSTLAEFINDLRTMGGPEKEFTFRDKRHFLETTFHEDTQMSEMYIFEIRDNNPIIARFFGKDFDECTDQFEEAKIFDGKTIYDVEDEIEVLFG